MMEAWQESDDEVSETMMKRRPHDDVYDNGCGTSTMRWRRDDGGTNNDARIKTMERFQPHHDDVTTANA